MKADAKKRKRSAVIIAFVMVALVALGGLAAWMSIQKNRLGTGDETEKVSYTFYEGKEAERLEDPEDVGVWISDCDTSKSFRSISGGIVTNRSGEYKQGVGALNVATLFSTTTLRLSLNETDISAHDNGSIHISMWVSNPECLSDTLTIEFTSSGQEDMDELCWFVPPSVLEKGWNELYLGLKDAKVKGEPDLTKINYSRMYTFGASYGFDIRLDSIYATDTPGMSLEAKAGVGAVATTKPGYLFDADSLTGLGSNGTISLTTAKGEYKEGKGAVGIFSPIEVWLRASIQPIDISACKEGKLSFWVWVNDIAYIKDADICIELTSSGTADKEEMNYAYDGAKLKTGWNEVEIKLDGGSPGSKGQLDWTAVNYVRVYAIGTDRNLNLIMDGMKVEGPTVLAPEDGMILNCDTKEDYRIWASNKFSVTNTPEEYKEGTGAYKSEGSGVIRAEVKMDNRVNVSAYKDGGIKFWLYVSDASKLVNAVIELGSGGEYDKDEYQWVVQGVRSGWQEITLDFASAKATGNPDLSRLNYFRIFTFECKGDITVILDEVKAVHIPKEEEEVLAPGVIMSCDTKKPYISLYGECGVEVTKKAGEFQVGTGAFKSYGAGRVRYQAKLREPVDISEYSKGSLQFYLYIGDKTQFISDGIKVELTSGGTCDVNELSWNVELEDLKENEWNLITLDFSSGTPFGGAIDYSKVNYLRMYTSKTETSEEALLILDHVHAVKGQNTEEQEKEPVKGMILDCDNTDNVTWSSSNNIKVTHNEGEFKEGTGAYRSKGTGIIWWQMILKEPVDVSEYAEGGLHLSLYVDDVSKLKDKIYVELGSSGKPDVNEYQWGILGNSLVSGAWNDVYLEFATDKGGDADLSKINWIRIFVPGGVSDAVTAYVDDIRAMVPTMETCYYLQDGAIYQADKPAKIWGTSSDGTEIKAELYKGDTLLGEDTVVVSDKRWQLSLPGQTGGYDTYTIKMYADGEYVAEYKDILFGQVWLAAGQSNMQLQLRDSYEGAELIAAANDSYLRVFRASSMPDGTGARTTAAVDIEGKWVQGNTSDIAPVSAVAYNFALKMRNELDVPFAILETSLGSTPIEAWLSKEMVDSDAELQAKMQELGVYTTGTKYTDLGAMYYSKIAPLTNANIAGVIWYQGESNAKRASIYAKQLDMLKENWGTQFGFENDSMPFVFTQLAPYTFSNSSDQMLLTGMMDAMNEFYRANETTTAMITNYDVSLQYTDTTVSTAAVIHPTVKKPVGERMALAAMGLVYGGEEATAPVLESYEMENGKAILKFAHVGNGLATTNDSIGVLGFALCDADGVWVNAKAEIIDDETVHVSSDFITEPVHVSYAYCDMNTDANLCASSGIPAAPFKTGGTGGFGSRSYLNCDEDTFVVTSFATTDSEVGHGEYKNLWTVSNRTVNSYDSSVKAQGIASVKSVYEAGTGEAIVGIDLTEAGKYSATAGLNNVGAVSVKMKNGDGRQKVVRLSITASNGTVAYTETQTLAANADFATVVFDITKLYDAQGNELQNVETVCSKMVKLSFCIQDTEAGTIWVDDIKLDGKVFETKPGGIWTCDSIPDYVSLNTGQLSNEQNCEGTGSIKAQGSNITRLMMNFDAEHEVNLKEVQKIKLSLYVNDTAYLGGDYWIYVGLGSDTTGNDGYRLNLKNIELNQGWNELEFDFSNTGNSNYGANLEKIRMFRIILRCTNNIHNTNLVTYVDNIRFVNKEETPKDLLFNCDSVPQNAVLKAGEVSNEQHCEGTGSFKRQGSDITRLMMNFNENHEVNLQGAQKIKLSLYVNDTAYLGGDYWIYVGLGSDTTGNDGYRLNLKDIELHQGWNELEFDFSNTDNSNYGANLAKIRMLRVILRCTGNSHNANLVTYIDNIRLVK